MDRHVENLSGVATLAIASVLATDSQVYMTRRTLLLP
jgi:hypothetical protein